MSPDEFGLWAANELAKKIDELGEDNIAAFIAEPIQGAGGVIFRLIPIGQRFRRFWMSAISCLFLTR